MKIHVPNELYERAKDLKSKYRQKGIEKSLHQCTSEIYAMEQGLVPDMKVIKQALMQIHDQQTNNKKGKRGDFGMGGRWLY